MADTYHLMTDVQSLIFIADVLAYQKILLSIDNFPIRNDAARIYAIPKWFIGSLSFPHTF